MSRSSAALAYRQRTAPGSRTTVYEDDDYRLLGAGYMVRDALAALERQSWQTGDDAYLWYDQPDPQAAFEPRRPYHVRATEPRRLVNHPAWLAITGLSLLFMAALVVPNLGRVRSAQSTLRMGYSAYNSGIALAAPEIDATTPSQELAPAQQPQPVSPAPPAGAYDITGAPSLSVAQIESVLQQYGSPATGKGQAIYDLGVRYGINPAYALAFFVHESGCGTKGVAQFTHSLGNIRWTPGYDNYEGYRSYDSWEHGIEDWYKLITELYINAWHLRTVDAIIPVYAPYADNNNPPAYIASVKQSVDSWRYK